MTARMAKLASGALAGAAMMSMAAAPIAAQAPPPVVGVNAAIHNSVQLRRGGQGLRPAVLRERVMLNDEISTGAASQLQMLLLDRSTFTVGANARLAIDRFVYDPARNTRSTAVSVTRGAFRFMSGRSLTRPTGPVTLRTPVASIGIRGTIFEGVVGADAAEIAAREPAVGEAVIADPETATLIVLRGPGPQTQGDTRPGAIDVTVGPRTIALDRPSLALYVPRPGADPIGPFEISGAGLASLSALLRPAPRSAAAMLAAGGGGPSVLQGGAGGASGGDTASGASVGTAGETGGSGGGPGGGVTDGGGKGRRQGLFVALGGLGAALAALLLASGDGDNGNGGDKPITP